MIYCFSSSKHAYSPVAHGFVVHFLACQSFGSLWQLVWETHTVQAAEIGYALSLHLTWQMQRKLHSCSFFFFSFFLSVLPLNSFFVSINKLGEFARKRFPIIFFIFAWPGLAELIWSFFNKKTITQEERQTGDADPLFEQKPLGR